MEKLKLIRFNDDNHAERIWANGEYIGSLNDIEFVLKNFMEICNKNKFEDIESTSIWVCDDFADYWVCDDFSDNEKDNEEMIDCIWEWFNTVEEMTPEEIELVENRNWEELYKII